MVKHNVIGYGYTIEIPRIGEFRVEQARELGIPVNCWSRLQKGETMDVDGQVFTPDMVLGPPRKGIKVTYCTDTRPVPAIMENARNADLLIIEGMYAEKEKEAKARQYKHMTFYEAAEVARGAEAREMWLTHFSPSLVRAEDYMGEVQKIFPNAKLGKDGKTVELVY